VPLFFAIDSSDSKCNRGVLSHHQALEPVRGSISIGLMQKQIVNIYQAQNPRPGGKGVGTSCRPIMGRGALRHANGAPNFRF
jgi:hypothetical protein